MQACGCSNHHYDGALTVHLKASTPTGHLQLLCVCVLISDIGKVLLNRIFISISSSNTPPYYLRIFCTLPAITLANNGAHARANVHSWGATCRQVEGRMAIGIIRLYGQGDNNCLQITNLH